MAGRLVVGWFVAAWVGCAGDVEPAARPQSAALLASWNGGRLDEAQVRSWIADDLRELEVRQQLERYEMWSRALDSAVEAALLEAARAESGLPSIDALVDLEVSRRLVEPPESEVAVDLERMEAQMPGRSREELRSSLMRVLMDNQREEARAAYIEDLKAKSGLKLYLPYPDVPRVSIDIAAHNPIIGPRDASVTLIQFVDFQCYYCRRAAPLLERLIRERPDDVRVVFKDFPLQGHPVARRAAVAAHCADQQGRYLEMSATLHRHLEHLEAEALRRYAVQVGLDLEAFEDCLRDPVWLDRVEEDARVGRSVGVEATPTMFINGMMVAGAVPYGRLVDLVDRERAKVAGGSGDRR